MPGDRDEHAHDGFKKRTMRMLQMPVGRRAVDRAVLAHWRYRDAIRERYSTNGDRRKQVRSHSIFHCSFIQYQRRTRTALDRDNL